MTKQTSARVIVAGTSAQGRPRLARIDIEGGQLQVLERDYVDPVVRSGRGDTSIAALGSITDVAGGRWLLAAVERGRPRLIDPERLGVIALLGRRREWRGAAEGRSPFLPVICDRPPVSAAGQSYMLTRSPSGGVDLLRACAGEPIERWWLGKQPTRVELLAHDRELALLSQGKVARIEVDVLVPRRSDFDGLRLVPDAPGFVARQSSVARHTPSSLRARYARPCASNHQNHCGEVLVPAGCPLLDPRDVELPLRWCLLPRSVVAVCELLDAALLRTIEREGDRWRVTELELDGETANPRASWAIDRPARWLARAGQLWIASANGWTRIDPGHGPREHSSALGNAMSPAAIEIDHADQAWLWLWRADLGELWRIDGRTLTPNQRWPLTLNLRARQLLLLAQAPAPEHGTVIHTDELAELLPFAPELHETWPTWFDR